MFFYKIRNMIKQLVERNRSYRRFDESYRISYNELISWIDLARLSASSRNQQALKFLPVVESSLCSEIFSHLAWAGYLEDWSGPAEGERPSAYVCILGDKNIASDFGTDTGIVAQSILLGAVDSGFGGCMIGSISREKLRKEFSIPDHLTIELVIALGKPVEKVQIENCINNDIRYWRDKQGVHHVPKRNLEELIYKL